MPLYLYRCMACQGEVETFRSLAERDDDDDCPECRSLGWLVRVPSPPALRGQTVAKT